MINEEEKPKEENTEQGEIVDPYVDRQEDRDK